MNADQLREIRERHERGLVMPSCACIEIDDITALLAEVDRLTTNIEDGSRTNANLRAEVERLKALCGRAEAHIRGIDDWYQHHYHDCHLDCVCGLDTLLTELRASK